MIAKPKRVLKTLVKHYNESEIGYIMSNMEELLDYLDEEVRTNATKSDRSH